MLGLKRDQIPRQQSTGNLTDFKEEGETISEIASFVKHYFDDGELAAWFSQLETLHYKEEMVFDDTHGNPHYHGITHLISRKPQT